MKKYLLLLSLVAVFSIQAFATELSEGTADFAYFSHTGRASLAIEGDAASAMLEKVGSHQTIQVSTECAKDAHGNALCVIKFN